MLVSHDLTVVEQIAARIVVLSRGRIVEQGTHAELLARGGLYARYWNRQSCGFLGTEPEEAQAAE